MNFRIILLTSVVLFALFPALLDAQGNIDFPPDIEAFYEIPSDWIIVDANEMIGVLKMLVGNAEQYENHLFSLSGKMSVVYHEGVDKEFAQQIGLQKVLNADKYTRKVVFSLVFKDDLRKSKMFRSKRYIESGFFTSDNKKIDFAHSTIFDVNSIVTAHEYIHTFNNFLHPSIPELLDYPETKDKKVAWREAPEITQNNTFVEFISPCQYFDLKYWNNAGFLLRCLEGDSGVDVRERAYKDIVLSRTTDKNGSVWFRMFQNFPSSGKFEMQEISIFWKQDIDFHPVVKLYKTTKGDLIDLLQVRWKKMDNMYFPVESLTVVNNPPGNLSVYRKISIEQIDINTELDPHSFSYSALGLTDGDILVDRIKQSVCMIRNDKPVYLAKFHEKYKTPRERGFNRIRMLLMAVGMGLVAFGIYLKIRRKISENANQKSQKYY